MKTSEQTVDRKLVTFRGIDSIYTFVNKAVISELLQSERIAGSIFFNQIQSYCKLQQHLDLVQSIFFMEAGHHMHSFAVELFDSLDQGLRLDNLVQLNAHFQNSIEGLGKHDFSAQDLQHKLSVEFADNPSKY